MGPWGHRRPDVQSQCHLPAPLSSSAERGHAHTVLCPPPCSFSPFAHRLHPHRWRGSSGHRFPPSPSPRRQRGIWTRGWWLFPGGLACCPPHPRLLIGTLRSASRMWVFARLQPLAVHQGSLTAFTPNVVAGRMCAPLERGPQILEEVVSPRGWPVAPRSHRRCLDPVILDSPLPPEADATGHPKCKTGARPPVTWPGSGHTFSTLLALGQGPRLGLSV